jgi:hypothetical protein
MVGQVDGSGSSVLLVICGCNLKRKMILFLLIVLICTAGAIIGIKSGGMLSVSSTAVAHPTDEPLSADQTDAPFIIDEKETPFLAKFRKLYESDDIKLFITIDAYLSCFPINNANRYMVPCTKKDVDKMEELAKLGDFFSLSVLAFNDRTNIEQALSVGEPVTTTMEAKRYFLTKNERYNEENSSQ